MMNYEKPVNVDLIEKAMATVGFESKVTYKTTSAIDGGKKNLELILREKTGGANASMTPKSSELKNHVEALLNEKFPDAKFSGGKISTLGPLIGWEFTKSAIISLVCAMAIMVFYLTIRYEFAYSVAANIALLHDVIVGVGVYLMFGGQITMQAVAAVMTVIGYSVNDTIITYDRIRENLKMMKGVTYSEVVNHSVNQMLGRTILTSMTVFIVLLMQFIFGGIAIRDFVSVMLVGVITGTYSSVYIAGPLVAIWHKDAGPNIKADEVEPKEQKKDERKSAAGALS